MTDCPDESGADSRRPSRPAAAGGATIVGQNGQPRPPFRASQSARATLPEVGETLDAYLSGFIASGAERKRLVEGVKILLASVRVSVDTGVYGSCELLVLLEAGHVQLTNNNSGQKTK